MTDLVTTDKQAMQALKRHGGNIVTVILLVVLAFFGWQFYQKNYAKIDTKAADSYTQITTQSEALNALTANQAEYDTQKQALFTQIDTLASEHGDTVYAWQALMTKARILADDNDFTQAAQSLTAASQVSIDDEGLLAISRLQLAKVQLAAKEIDAALATINQAFPESFEPSRLEILGDVYIAQNQNDKAKEAYEKAWQLLAERQEIRALLKLKMEALGLVPPEITPKPAIVPEVQNQAATPLPTNTPPANTPTAEAQHMPAQAVDLTPTTQQTTPPQTK